MGLAQVFHQGLSIEISGEVLGIVDAVETIAKGEQTLFYLGQRLLEFSHQNIEDVDLCHKHSIRFEVSKQFFPHFACDRVCIFFDLGYGVSYLGGCLSFEYKCVQDAYLDVSYGTQGVSKSHLDLSHDVLCGSILQTLYPNVYISSTNTGSSTGSWRCVGQRFSAR